MTEAMESLIAELRVKLRLRVRTRRTDYCGQGSGDLFVKVIDLLGAVAPSRKKKQPVKPDAMTKTNAKETARNRTRAREGRGRID